MCVMPNTSRVGQSPHVIINLQTNQIFSSHFWTMECNQFYIKNTCWRSFHQQSHGTESELMLTSLSCRGLLQGVGWQYSRSVTYSHSASPASNFTTWNPFPQYFFRTSYKLQHFGHRLFQLVSEHCIVLYKINIVCIYHRVDAPGRCAGGL